MKKKLYILLAISFLTMITFAQSLQTAPSRVNTLAEKFLWIGSQTKDLRYKMAKYHTDNNYIIVTFCYADDGYLCDAIFHQEGYESDPNRYQLYDSLHYDVQGHLDRIDGYQMVNGSWRHGYYVLYTYNDQGLVASRQNYNNISDNFVLGGTYHYTYNEAGQITFSQLTFLGGVYDQTEYFYENGQLTSTLYSIFDGISIWEPMEKFEHTYNEQGLLTRSDKYDNNGGWELEYYEEYTYDELGNCIEYRMTDHSGTILQRHLYEFESRLHAETIIPDTPEQESPRTYSNHNIYNRSHYYTVDDNMVLQYLCDYIYVYDELTDIQDVEENNMQVWPNPATNMVRISGQTGDYMLKIYDMQGRCVKMQRMDGDDCTVDVSTLRNGQYLICMEGKKNRSAKITVRK